MWLGKVEGGNLSAPRRESYCNTSGLSTMLRSRQHQVGMILRPDEQVHKSRQ